MALRRPAAWPDRALGVGVLTGCWPSNRSAELLIAWTALASLIRDQALI